MTESVLNLSVTPVNLSSDVKNHFLISNDTTRILHWFLFAVLCQAISIFGVGSNIINITCFIRQGLKDPVNISLLGLAVSDLGCLLFSIWTNICYTPSFRTADLPFEPIEFQYLASGWPHVAFSHLTAWITAIVTLERCLCITFPLKVGSLVTSKRMSIVIACFFVIILSSLAPIYVVNRFCMKFFPAKNKTLIGIVPTDSREITEKITFPIINIFLPFTAFAVIVVCTITLVYKLKEKTRWRKTFSKTAQAANTSNRDHGVAKMVTMIAALFIACFSPMSITFIGMSTEPELSVDGKYRNTLTVIGAACSILESINSSSNIFIYYCMSSKYRAMFLELFRINT